MTHFKIETKSNGLIVANFATNDVNSLNNITKGESATFRFDFNDKGTDLTVASGETYTVETNTIEAYNSIVVDGTLTVNGTLFGNDLTVNGTVNNNGTIDINEGQVIDYDTLLDYDEYAGKYTRLETFDAAQPYREFIDTTDFLDSLVFGIEPEPTLQNEDIPGVWGLVSGIEDSRNNPLSVNRFTITVDILATYNEYADHASLETALKV